MTLDLVRCSVDENYIVRSKTPTIVIPDDLFVGEMLFKGFNANPERLVMIDHESDRKWTAGQVKDITLKLATALDSIGLSRGKHVSLYLPNDDMHAMFQFAVYTSANVLVGVFWTDPYRELFRSVEKFDSCAIVCCEENFETAQKVADELDKVEYLIISDYDVKSSRSLTANGKKVYSLQELLATVSDGDLFTEPIPISGHPQTTLAAVIFSSGSTGFPKGVMRTHTNLVARVIPTFRAEGWGKNAAIVSGTHHLQWSSIIMSMASYCAYILCEAFDARSFLESVERHKVSVCVLSPTFVVQLTKSGLVDKYDTSSLRAAYVGGAPLQDSQNMAFHDAFKLTIKGSYSATETGDVTVGPRDLENHDTVGALNPNVEVKVVNRETGEAMGPDKVGELYVRSPTVSTGYYNSPAETAENFTEDGFFKTGDKVYYDKEGLFFIVDRYKEVFFVGIKTVAPAGIESLLLERPFVKEAAIVGTSDEKYGHVPRAFVVLDGSVGANESTAHELIESINGQVSDWKRLRGGIAFVDQLPKLRGRKIDRLKLKLSEPEKVFFLE